MKTTTALSAILIPIVLATSAAADVQGDVAGIYDKTGVKGGLVVHVGCGDGKLTAALRVNDGYLVQGLDKDPQNIAAARKNIAAADYGKVSINHFDGTFLPYADNLVNLLVIEEDAATLEKEEILRVLAPRGVALVDGGMVVKPVPAEIGEWNHHMSGADNNGISHDTKVGFPQYMQWKAKPDFARHHATAQGVEAIVSSKGRVFYIVDLGEPSIGDSLPSKWTLVARDAFSGVELWSRPVDHFSWKEFKTSVQEGGRFGYPKQRHRRLVAVDDHLYVTLGLDAPVSVLDAATGKIVRTLEGTELCSEIIHKDGLLYLSMRTQAGEEAKYYVMAVDPDTGEILWKSGSYTGNEDRFPAYRNLFLAVGDEELFFLDEKSTVCLDLKTGKELWQSDASHTYDAEMLRAGLMSRNAVKGRIDRIRSEVYNEVAPKLGLKIKNKKPTEAAPKEAAPKDDKEKEGKEKEVDAATAAKRAKKAAKAKKKSGTEPITDANVKRIYGKTGFWRLVYHDGVVYLLNPYGAPNLSAVDAKTGEVLWQAHKEIVVYGTPSQMFVAQDLVWVWGTRMSLEGLDLKTGEVVKDYDMTQLHRASLGHIRCYPEKGTSNTLWTTNGGKDQQMIDLTTGEVSSMPWLRGACRVGILPANGMLYMTPHPCMCHPKIKLKGLLGFSPDRSQKVNAAGPQLSKGPAYGKDHPRDPARSEDWPMYRHDGSRENTSSTVVSPSPEMAWQADLKGKLTQPVIANGMVYVVSIDAHTVYALDEATGKPAWKFIAGARIDSAPTCYQGKILFGSTDGHVYCLTARDGELVWKYRMVPEQRHVVIYDQLESAWPVTGTLVVHDGKIVVIAGRSSYVDGGLHMALLDPETGEASKLTRLDTTGLKYSSGIAPGALRDVVLSKGDSLHMHFSKLSTEGQEIEIQDAFSLLADGGPGRVRAIKKETMFLTGTGGMLHEGIFHRSGMMFGKSWGQIMALGDEATYAVQHFKSWGNHNGPTFMPGRDKAILVRSDPAVDGEKWSVEIPLVARSILTSGDLVFLAGTPEEIDPQDPWKNFEGRGTGRILVYSTKDGKEAGSIDLPAAPVTDGLAAANKKLFVSLKDGKLQCWK